MAFLVATGRGPVTAGLGAEELGIALIDAGHFPTEIIMADAVRLQLQQRLAAAGYEG